MRDGPVSLRPCAREDAAALRAIHAAPGVREWWGPPEDDFPATDDPEATRFTILVDDRIAGMVQFYEEDDPGYRHAMVDILLDPAVRGRGHGPRALGLLVRHLAEARGHHRVTIDPASENVSAIRSFEKAGFRPVGILEAAWRDEDGRWRDSLLMERVDRGAISRT